MANGIKNEFDESNKPEGEEQHGIGAGFVTGLYGSLTSISGLTSYVLHESPKIYYGDVFQPYLDDGKAAAMAGIVITGGLAHQTYKCVQDYARTSHPIKFAMGMTAAAALVTGLTVININNDPVQVTFDETPETVLQQEASDVPTVETVLEDNNLTM